MEIRQLEYFLAVAEELHFGRAAERLHIGQPAVSQQISRLERELGTELLERNTRRVRLTTAGARLLPETRAVLAALGRLRLAAIDPGIGVSGVLRLGTSEGLGERLDQVLELVKLAAPELEVRLVSMPAADRLTAVRAHDLDVAFLRPGGSAPGLSSVPVWTERLVAALPATHPLAARRRLGLQDLASLPLRMSHREANPGFYDLVTSSFREAGEDPVLGPPIHSMDDALTEIGTAGGAWTVLYSSAVARIRAPRLAFRHIADPKVRTFVVSSPGAAKPGVDLVLESCRAVDLGSRRHPMLIHQL